MNQSLLDRAKKAGVILVFHSYMWEHGDKLASYGEKRLAMIHAVPHRHRHGNSRRWPFRFHGLGRRSAAAHSGHGDAQRRKRRRYTAVNQRVSVEEAIKVWTLDGAYATFEEKNKGSIAPGKLADFAVLRKDPRKVRSGYHQRHRRGSHLHRRRALSGRRSRMRWRAGMRLPDTFYGDGDELENLGHDRE